MDQITEEAVRYIKALFAEDFSGHDFSHSMRVYRTAVALAEKEGADLKDVSLAALLHDADDRKLSPQTCESKDNAVRFMREHGIAEERISRIVRIIEEVSFRGTDSVVPSTFEGKCVQDADRLDALGAIGIARAFAYGGSRNREMYDPEIPPLTGMDGKAYQDHTSTTVNHFYEKLFLLRDMMTTDTGKQLAEKRDAFMRAWLSEFLDEWEGKA